MCKNDPDVYKSENHPDLQELGSPTTKKCMSAYRQKCRKRKLDKNTEITVSQLNGLNTINGNQMQNASQSKVRRLSNLVKNNIKNENYLFVKATEQQKAAKEDLYNFLVNRSPKSRQDLIMTTWKMQNGKASSTRLNTPRMTMISEAAGVAECVEGCGDKWLKCALEVLQEIF